MGSHKDLMKQLTMQSKTSWVLPRHGIGASSFLCRLGVVNDRLDGSQLLSLLLRYFDAKLLFQGHDQFDCVQGVSTKVANERCFICDFGLVDTQLFCDHLLHIFLKINTDKDVRAAMSCAMGKVRIPKEALAHWCLNCGGWHTRMNCCAREPCNPHGA